MHIMLVYFKVWNERLCKGAIEDYIKSYRNSILSI
jgi:hypothetical protein